MVKPESKRSEVIQQAKHVQKPVPMVQVKADNKLTPNEYILSDTTRVVFSEEINRNTEMDDG